MPSTYLPGCPCASKLPGASQTRLPILPPAPSPTHLPPKHLEGGPQLLCLRPDLSPCGSLEGGSTTTVPSPNLSQTPKESPTIHYLHLPRFGSMLDLARSAPPTDLPGARHEPRPRPPDHSIPCSLPHSQPSRSFSPRPFFGPSSSDARALLRWGPPRTHTRSYTELVLIPNTHTHKQIHTYNITPNIPACIHTYIRPVRMSVCRYKCMYICRYECPNVCM
jgi:hypothetical protein